METAWIFTRPKARSPAGAFTSREVGKHWIQQPGLSGTLTAYPVDVEVYDWVVARGHFAPKRDDQRPGLPSALQFSNPGAFSS